VTTDVTFAGREHCDRKYRHSDQSGPSDQCTEGTTSRLLFVATFFVLILPPSTCCSLPTLSLPGSVHGRRGCRCISLTRAHLEDIAAEGQRRPSPLLILEEEARWGFWLDCGSRAGDKIVVQAHQESLIIAKFLASLVRDQDEEKINRTITSLPILSSMFAISIMKCLCFKVQDVGQARPCLRLGLETLVSLSSRCLHVSIHPMALVGRGITCEALTGLTQTNPATIVIFNEVRSRDNGGRRNQLSTGDHPNVG
jgi:hypothetical protein